MFSSSCGILSGFVLMALVMLAGWKTQAVGVLSEEGLPTHTFVYRFSTNWYAEVREALPAKYSEKANLTWREATNGLCQASRKGKLPAQALWGFALVVLQLSPDATNAGLKLLVDAADKGYVPAMVNLGYLFEITNDVPQDYLAAFQWFSRAAALGNDEAQLQLGGCYHYGLGTNQDFSIAAKYYRLAAGQSNAVAMKCLGYLLMNGEGVETNLDEAKYWLTRAAKEGRNRRAMFDLGVLALQKYPDTNAILEGLQWMKQSADLGDALAANEVTNDYLRGWGGTQPDVASYRDWRLKAALLGSTDAQYFMGQAYRNGDGVSNDMASALMWLKKAAAKNHPEALYDLAVYYHEDATNPASLQMSHDDMLRAAQLGHREAQFQIAMSCFRGDLGLDIEGGKTWLAKAAENQWAEAEFALFQLYYNGLAPGKDCPAYPKDKAEGVKWLRRAADHENLQAQAILAVMLIRGMDMEQNKEEAGRYLRYAAEHGFAGAQNDLGFAILDGDVASTNATEAAMWCRLAMNNSTDPNVTRRAGVNLTHALSLLTFDQQQAATYLAQSFKPLASPEMDPKIKDWERNPIYQREDGQFGH